VVREGHGPGSGHNARARTGGKVRLYATNWCRLGPAFPAGARVERRRAGSPPTPRRGPEPRKQSSIWSPWRGPAPGAGAGRGPVTRVPWDVGLSKRQNCSSWVCATAHFLYIDQQRQAPPGGDADSICRTTKPNRKRETGSPA
jgi:hypothetical protein